MNTIRLLGILLLSFSLLGGCIDLSEDDKAELKSFLDGYAEEENEAVGLTDARDKDYLGSTDVDESDTTGSARIGGVVAVSTLEDNTQANRFGSSQINSRGLARTVDELTASNFTVSFINGSGVKTTITGTYTVLVHYPSDGSDPQFIIEGLGDGVNYIVEVAVTVDGEDLSLKSVAYVPPGATKSEKAVIDPISTVVAEAVQEKVTSGFFATGGDKFSQDYISDLNETMTAVIEEVIESNPEITITNFEVAITSDTGIDNLVTKLLATEEVNESLDLLEDVAVEEKFEAPDAADITDAQVARDYMVNLFDELFNDSEDGKPDEGGGAPQFFIDFFGDKFYEETQGAAPKTVADVFAALEDGFTPEGGGASTFDTAKQTETMALFKSVFAFIYSAFDQVANETTSVTVTDPFGEGTFDRTLADAREFLEKEIPPTLLAVFPPEDRATLAAYGDNSTLTVPQVVTMIFFVMELAQDDCDSSDPACNPDSGGDNFNPLALLQLYDFTEADFANYDTVSVGWLGVHPGSMWVTTDETTDAGEQLDVLNAFTCVDSFFAGDTFTINGVTLTYPTSGGTNTISLVDESTYWSENDGGGDHSCWVWDTWQEQRLLEESGNYNVTTDHGEEFNWNTMIADLQSAGKIISDFTSGDYTVTVNYTDDGVDGTLTKTFDKKIITGLQQLNPRLTTPASQPRHPEGNVSPEEWEAYWAAQQNFTPTTFPAGAIGTIKWNAPVGLADALPEGVIAAYSMDIGRNTGCQEGQNCEWQNIFNTWEDNIQIFDTEFELPQYAKNALVALDLNDPDGYQINISISFLDAQTGEYLGQGGWSHTTFRVGQSISGSDTFTISGSTANVPNNQFTDDSGTAYPASAYQVALVEETCNDQGCTYETLLNSDIAEDGSYSLMPTFDQAKGSNGSWINLTMYIDANGNGQYDTGTEDNNFMWEHQFWSHDHMNFNTWGGVLRLGRHTCDQLTGICEYTEEAAVPNGTYTGPTFDAMPEEFSPNAAGETEASPQ